MHGMAHMHQFKVMFDPRLHLALTHLPFKHLLYREGNVVKGGQPR